jgi:hypothetical protein
VLKELKATLEQQVLPEPMVQMADQDLKVLKVLKAQRVIVDQRELQDPLVEMELDPRAQQVLQDLKDQQALQDLKDQQALQAQAVQDLQAQ